ncbi:hypothetical protein M8C13_19835 [Crossiella sp. SN42]|uniref:hypothetical protein n=1 Tax=Crossiella sp. SN42 TaxID=2944808 RepID=UPI00207D69E5|nr:hypothetical protein [Crossiella sp. SN42]MCO1578006.1 hypothetical protein [Crossiella sp. SN42]
MAKHLVMTGRLIDEEPERALAHARFARRKASRIGLVREATGLAAYHAGEWSEALAELRAARRMTGSSAHLAVMADCERALGRPERALELARSTEAKALSAEEAVELRIVAAGARRDLGELDAAVVALQGPDLDVKRRDPWSARLFYAYADNLAAAGRNDEAIQWFISAAEVDDDGETDAAERAIELGAGPVVPVDVEDVDGDEDGVSDDRDGAQGSGSGDGAGDAAEAGTVAEVGTADEPAEAGEAEVADKAAEAGTVAEAEEADKVVEAGEAEVADKAADAGTADKAADAGEAGTAAEAGEAEETVLAGESVEPGASVEADAVVAADADVVAAEAGTQAAEAGKAVNGESTDGVGRDN